MIYKIIILLCSVIPFLKQFIALKYLVNLEIVQFGYIFGLIYFLQGVSSIGWIDLATINLTKKHSLKNLNVNYFLYIGLIFIILINIIILPIFIMDINSFATYLIIILCSIFLTKFQILNKLVRAYGLLKIFFINLLIKNLLDLLLFLILIYFNEFHLVNILITEIITSMLLVGFYIKKRIIYRFYIFKYKIYKLKQIFLNNISYSLNLFIMGICSTALIFYDRIVYAYILPVGEYNQYLFYNLIIMLSFSLNSFILSIAYSKLVLLQKFEVNYIKKFLDTKIFIFIFILCILSPIMYYLIMNINLLYYSHIKIESLNTILVIVIFILNSSDFYEKYNILTNNKKVLILQILLIILIFISILFMYIKQNYTIDKLLILYLIVKIVYMIYNRKLIISVK